MSAVAILTCQPSSHPFQERHIALIEPVKIGRSVARARPAPNNGIFDCKVLSRNHAMLWYENGKFYLQDTKSSNGTFINNQRLCKGGEESAPKDIYSGDHIQFGVDVMENNRRGEKITHGCIIATITLFHPDGREAKNIYSDSGSFCNTVTPGITIQSQELYQLSQYLQEALHREKMLEQKLGTLQQLVNNTQEASENGWQALIDEDRLLSRLEVLENQLHTYSKNHSEDALRQEVVALQEEKLQYETTSKDSLRKVLQEKLDAVRKLTDLERSLSNTQDECSHLKDMCEKLQDELQQLAEKYQDQLKEIQELQEKLHEAERKHVEESDRIEKEKLDLTEKLENMMKQESELTAKIESMQLENDIASEQLAAMKAKLEAIKEPTTTTTSSTTDNDNDNENDNEKETTNNLDLEKDENEKLDEEEKSDDDKTEKLPNNSHPLDNESEIIPTSQKEIELGDVEGKLRETQQQIERYKAKLEESNSKLKESSDNVEQIQKELEMAKLDSMQYVAKISSLEDQLKESHKQSDGNTELTESLQDKINELEAELSLYRIPQSEKALNVTLVGTSNRDDHLHNNIDHIDGTELGDDIDDNNLKELLRNARDLNKKAEIEINRYKDEKEKAGEECTSLRVQLTEAQRLSQEKTDMVEDLQDQLKKAESTTKEVKQQILTLRGQLDQEKSKHKDTKKELEESKQKLLEVQQAAKQSHNESEQHKNKVRHLQERIETERKERGRELHHSRFSHPDSHSPTPTSAKHRGNITAEFAALKEECAGLRKRIQAIEAEMKMSRKENLQLSSEYNKLQESYKQLEVLKTQLENREVLLKTNLTDSQKETEQTKQELSEEIAILKSSCQCEAYKSRIAELECEINNATLENKQLADRSKVLSFCSSIPLLMLLFAILMALYPTLAQITATT